MIGLLALLAGAPDPTQRLRPSGLRETRVGGAQLLDLAGRAERSGDTALAERFYRAMLEDSDRQLRNEARFRLARIHAGRGQWADGARLLRNILDEEPAQPRVRLELAGLLVRMGNEAAARRELRAAQAARPPVLLARLIDRYAAALRDRRPFGAELGLALAPDSNINRATSRDRLETVFGDFTIDSPGQARSGLGLAIDGSAFARLAVNDDLALVAHAGGRYTGYRGTRYDRLSLAGRLGAQLAIGRDRLSLALASQRHRVGGATQLAATGVEFDWLHPLSSRTQLRIHGGASALDNRRNELEDGRLFQLGGEIDHALAPGTALGLSIGATRRMAKDPAFASRSVEVGIRGSQEIGRLTLAASWSGGWLRADDRLTLFPQRRRDISQALTLGLTSRHIEWRGFAPSVKLSLERTRSHIAIFDSRRRAIEIGLARAF